MSRSDQRRRKTLQDKNRRLEDAMKMEFGIVWGLVIASLWLVIRALSLGVIVFSIAIFPLVIPVISETAGYYLTLRILRQYRWPEESNLSAYAGKWIAILVQVLSALCVLVVCLSLFFVFLPLLIVPPTLLGCIFCTYVLFRYLRQSMKPYHAAAR